MPLLSDANVGEYISLYYDEAGFKSFNDFCRSITGRNTDKVSSNFARLIADGPYGSMTLGWIENPGGAWELENDKFPEYIYGWMLDPTTEVAAIHKTLLLEAEASAAIERPCYQCQQKNFTTDKSCWWCMSPNPTKPR